MFRKTFIILLLEEVKKYHSRLEKINDIQINANRAENKTKQKNQQKNNKKKYKRVGEKIRQKQVCEGM